MIAVVAAVLALSGTLLAACATGGSGSTPEPPGGPELGMFTARDECGDTTGATVCERTATDPRMTGKARILSGGPSGVAIESIGIVWASFDLSNDGGEWACKDLIIGESVHGVGMRDQVCVGKGGYEGLMAYAHATTPDKTATWGVHGWITNDQ
jgi:hypothetical protein